MIDGFWGAFAGLLLIGERQDAARDRRALQAAAGLPYRPNLLVRGLANGLALVSRSSTAAVRRLDDCVADDLNQALAASK